MIKYIVHYILVSSILIISRGKISKCQEGLDSSAVSVDCPANVYCLGEKHHVSPWKVQILKNKDGKFELAVGSAVTDTSVSKTSKTWIAVAFSENATLGKNNPVAFCVNDDSSTGIIGEKEQPEVKEWIWTRISKSSKISEKVLQCTFILGTSFSVVSDTNETLYFDLDNEELFVHFLRGADDDGKLPISTKAGYLQSSKTANMLSDYEWKDESVDYTNGADVPPAVDFLNSTVPLLTFHYKMYALPVFIIWNEF